MNPEAILDQALSSKEAGNQHFRKGEYDDAVKCYSQALLQCPQDHEYGAIILKNRAACYLKLQQHLAALSDCTQALHIAPNDIKTLYRRALAYESIGNLTDAFADLKRLLSIEPQNKEATELARKLTATIKKQQDHMQSTDGLLEEIFRSLKNPKLSQAKQIVAAKNCAILSREPAGAIKMYEAGVVPLLLPFLDSCETELVHHVLQTFIGLCTGQKARAYAVVQSISLEKISALISHESSEVSCSAIALVKQVILSISSEDMHTPKGVESATPDVTLIIPVVQMMFILLLNKSVTSISRDHIMEMLMSTIPKVK